MDIKERVLLILRKVKPTISNWEFDHIIDEGYLDSFELLYLISSLCEEFDIKIKVEDVVPENFNSIDCIVNMINRLK